VVKIRTMVLWEHDAFWACRFEVAGSSGMDLHGMEFVRRCLEWGVNSEWMNVQVSCWTAATA
jgi:hypothetical protein